MKKRITDIPEWEDNLETTNGDSAIKAKMDNIEVLEALKESTAAIAGVGKSVDDLNTQLHPVLEKVEDLISSIKAASEIRISEETLIHLQKIAEEITSVTCETVDKEARALTANIKKQVENVVARMATTDSNVTKSIDASANSAVDKLTKETGKAYTSFKTAVDRIATELSQHVDKAIHRMNKHRHGVSIPVWLFVMLIILFTVLCSLLTLIFYENAQHWHYDQLTQFYDSIMNYLTKGAIIISLISIVGSIFLYLAKKFPYG